MKHLLLPIFLMTFAVTSCVQTAGSERTADDRKTRGPQYTSVSETNSAGRVMFLKNCAHCHGADAHGDEGPDLHNLDWTDAQIGARIRNGKKGQMTAFAGKLKRTEIDALVAYVRSLK
jgi:mono/diheme cytochrome c family protein